MDSDHVRATAASSDADSDSDGQKLPMFDASGEGDDGQFDDVTIDDPLDMPVGEALAIGLDAAAEQVDWMTTIQDAVEAAAEDTAVEGQNVVPLFQYLSRVACELTNNQLRLETQATRQPTGARREAVSEIRSSEQEPPWVPANLDVSDAILTRLVDGRLFEAGERDGSASRDSDSGRGQLVDAIERRREPTVREAILASIRNADEITPTEARELSTDDDLRQRVADLQSWAAVERDRTAARRTMSYVGEMEEYVRLCDEVGTPTLGIETGLQSFMYGNPVLDPLERQVERVDALAARVMRRHPGYERVHEPVERATGRLAVASAVHTLSAAGLDDEAVADRLSRAAGDDQTPEAPDQALAAVDDVLSAAAVAPGDGYEWRGDGPEPTLIEATEPIVRQSLRVCEAVAGPVETGEEAEPDAVVEAASRGR